MDLRLFHPDPSSGRIYKRLDRLNGRTHPLACRWLDLIGWYYGSVSQCLLGHYRFYNNYKKHYRGGPQDIPPDLGYVLQRKISFAIKYRVMYFCVYIVKMWGIPERTMEVYIINRTLLHEKSSILRQFLIAAETDPNNALKQAMERIRALEFSDLASSRVEVKPIEEPKTKDALPGKEKDILSKRQTLIYYDLMSECYNLPRFELANPNKHGKIAAFLRSVTGRTIATWLEELAKYKNKGVYDFDKEGELKDLIRKLKNLDEILFKAGQTKLHNAAQKKLKELEQKENHLLH